VNSLVMQLPEPEIYLPAGTELTLTLTGPLRAAPESLTKRASAAQAGALPPTPRKFTREERAALDPIVRSLPSRALASSGRPSDIVNLVIIGSRGELAAALRATGWTEARPATLRSRMSVAFAVVKGRGFPDAPMSELLLNDAPPDMAWEKGFNDFAKRHHIRLWRQGESAGGPEIWGGAATRDVDFGFLRRGGLVTHEIARQVDRERDKVVEDLAFTSCADAADLWERPGAPHSLKNATGDAMVTDGRLAVVRLNRCDEPAGALPPADPLPVHGNRWEMILRRQILNFRSDVLRDNWFWRSYEGLRYLVVACERKPAPDPEAAPLPTRASRLQPDWLTTVVSLR
jgi:hypothetical protein